MQHNLKIFGPDKFSAELEGSKIFAKNFMKKFNVSTAKYESFDNVQMAKQYIRNNNTFPIVIKADGLAAGKGVDICCSETEAIKTIDNFMINNAFKGAGLKIVIEEYLKGVEASIICVTDGKIIKPLISAKDYKTINENNSGPNTGGMGAICPNPYMTNEVFIDFEKNIMKQTLIGIKEMKMNFKGFIFFGVMITNSGCKLLEYNVRMGDPECQSIVLSANFDFLEMFFACIEQKLNSFTMNWKDGVSINVVLTSGGYPNTYIDNQKINIIGKQQIFFAGTKLVNNILLTSGGRVLSVASHCTSKDEAIKTIYEKVKNISFNNMHYRKDIGS
jgi:phosphoribosylamine--glycine ligase